MCHYKYIYFKERVRKQSPGGRCVVGVWSVCGRCVVGVWSVCGRCVVGVWSVCGRCVVGVSRCMIGVCSPKGSSGTGCSLVLDILFTIRYC